MMKSRFEGENGKKLLTEALENQELIKNNKEIAGKFSKIGELIEYDSDINIITQDASDNSVYFILSGDVNIYVNDRFVGSRSSGDCIGEMAAIDATAPRSATVKSKNKVLVFKVEEDKFKEIFDENPILYKGMAKVLAERLRERSKDYLPPNNEPSLFIGSSSESINIANEIQAGFKYDSIDAVVWTNGIFGISGSTIESLESIVDKADFAAFIISSDDVTSSRGKEINSPRDNIIFELGLFMGKIKRQRVFIIKDEDSDIKIPTDLLNVTLLTYKIKNDNLKACINPICHEIRQVIKKLGVR